VGVGVGVGVGGWVWVWVWVGAGGGLVFFWVGNASSVRFPPPSPRGYPSLVLCMVPLGPSAL